MNGSGQQARWIQMMDYTWSAVISFPTGHGLTVGIGYIIVMVMKNSNGRCFSGVAQRPAIHGAKPTKNPAYRLLMHE
jgi:hypothetical protein